MQLKNDIWSSFNHVMKYGSIGDKVKVVGDHHNVLIVENEDGNRFPVLRIHCTEEYVKPIAAPVTAAPNININRAPVTRRKAVPINQTSIF